MKYFLMSVLDKTARDRVSLAQLVHLGAWDGDLSPDEGKKPRLSYLVEDLIEWGKLKPHVVQIWHSSQDTYVFPDPHGVDGWSKASWGNDRFRWFDNKTGRWLETSPVGRGEARPINELPQGAKPHTWKTEEVSFTAQEVARCLRELGDKGAELKSQGLAVWLGQHGESVDGLNAERTEDGSDPLTKQEIETRLGEPVGTSWKSLWERIGKEHPGCRAVEHGRYYLGKVEAACKVMRYEFRQSGLKRGLPNSVFAFAQAR